MRIYFGFYLDVGKRVFEKEWQEIQVYSTQSWGKIKIHTAKYQ